MLWAGADDGLVGENPPAGALIEAAPGMARPLTQVNMKGSEANLAFPGMLNEQYATFAAMLEDADTAPTTQETQRLASLHSQLQAQLAAWAALRRATGSSN